MGLVVYFRILVGKEGRKERERERERVSIGNGENMNNH